MPVFGDLKTVCRRKSMERIVKAFGIGLAAVVIFWGCALGGDQGTVTVGMTDAPIDVASVKEVDIVVTDIQYNLSSGSEDNWKSFDDFAGPRTIDLLSKTDGAAEVLGTLALPAGQYNQIRFMLAAPEEGTAGDTSGSRIVFNDASAYPLYVPSADKTGFKAVNAFQVPVNGDVKIMVDFDLRRAVRTTTRYGGVTYALRPALRLIVENEAGSIFGKVASMPSEKVAVFAYANGTYAASEADLPAVDSTDTTQFANSVTSAVVKLDGTTGDWRYTLPFLSAGIYDLVVASMDPATEAYYAVDGYIPDIVVESDARTTADFDFSALSTAALP
jgi:hypothetical protein